MYIVYIHFIYDTIPVSTEDESLILSARTVSTGDTNRRFYLIRYKSGSTDLQNITGAYTLYSKSILSWPTAIDFDFRRKTLYSVDIQSGLLYKVEPYSWETVTSDNISSTPIHFGLSHQYMKIAFDWRSNNLYWTDERFAWIMILSLTRPEAFKVLIHEHLQRPLGIAVDPKNK